MVDSNVCYGDILIYTGTIVRQIFIVNFDYRNLIRDHDFIDVISNLYTEPVPYFKQLDRYQGSSDMNSPRGTDQSENIDRVQPSMTSDQINLISRPEPTTVIPATVSNLSF